MSSEVLRVIDPRGYFATFFKEGICPDGRGLLDDQKQVLGKQGKCSIQASVSLASDVALVDVEIEPSLQLSEKDADGYNNLLLTLFTKKFYIKTGNLPCRNTADDPLPLKTPMSRQSRHHFHKATRKKNSSTTENKTIERLTSQLSEVKKEAKQRLRDSQKWEKMYKDEKSEREISDARLTKEEEKVKNLQSKLDGQMDSLFKKRVDASLKEERKKTTFYRNQMLDMAKRLELHSRDALGGEPPAWKICEICTFEYENVEGRIPRILDCGHTLCESCITQLVDRDRIVDCPFDRISMQMRAKHPKCLKKNYAVLQM